MLLWLVSAISVSLKGNCCTSSVLSAMVNTAYLFCVSGLESIFFELRELPLVPRTDRFPLKKWTNGGKGLLTQHALVGFGQAHVLFSARQHKAHDEDLHAVGHECQTQDEVEGPLEAAVAALLQDALVLLRQFFLILPALARRLAKVPELSARRHPGPAQLAVLFARVCPRDALVLALVNLVILIVALSGVAMGSLVIVGPAVTSVVAPVLALHWVLIVVILLKARVGALGVLVRHSVHSSPNLLRCLPLHLLGDVLGAPYEGGSVPVAVIHVERQG